MSSNYTKINRRQLRQLINEELNRLNESNKEIGIVKNADKEKAEAAVLHVRGFLPDRLEVELRGTGTDEYSVVENWSVAVTGFLETAEDREADMRQWVNHLNKKVSSPMLVWGQELDGELTIIVDP